MSPEPAAEAPKVQLPARLMFRFQLRARRHPGLDKRQPFELDDSYALPPLFAVDGIVQPVTLRLAWHEAGLLLDTEVRGKTREVWCRENQLVNSEGVRVWINTRPLGDVRRAGKFCRQLALLPFGGGKNRNEPVCGQLAINRAKEQAPVIEGDRIRAAGRKLPDGYRMTVFLDAATLTGYSPKETPMLGLNVSVIDFERGNVTLSVDGKLPYDEDPSLWPNVELVTD